MHTETTLMPDDSEPATPPPFLALLENPIVAAPLPSDFRVDAEAAHLLTTWEENASLRKYQFHAFVHAGGSGMNFKVTEQGDTRVVALKIARCHLVGPSHTNEYSSDKGIAAAESLSPVPPNELRALKSLAHEHLVSLIDAISDSRNSVFAIATTYVEQPSNLDAYLRSVLERSAGRRAPVDLLAPNRIDDACRFLLGRVVEVASALEHMHSRGVYHFDIKPANILIAGAGTMKHRATVTDMGACLHRGDHEAGAAVRVQFTYSYAHPMLAEVHRDLRSITGGGLKVTNTVVIDERLARYDLYALGRTIQECLAIYEMEFGDRCYASYLFRYMHLIAALLLDGRNVPGTDPGEAERMSRQHGRHFVQDTPLGYTREFFGAARIHSASDLMIKLKRAEGSFSAARLAPELAPVQHDVINSVVHSPGPFTGRVAAIVNHPTMRRLTREPQLGWMRDIFPGATHDRWSHSVGVFSALTRYHISLLFDPDNPLYRIIATNDDIEHSLVAALVHDLGQTTFGHDFEEVDDVLFNHEKFVPALISETFFANTTLQATIVQRWPRISLERVMQILRGPEASVDPKADVNRVWKREDYIDGVLHDLISGPIDADKLDYLLRDSRACGVPYGKGVDVDRLVRALTIAPRRTNVRNRLGLAYRAKGRAGVSSLALARYQMFEAVYWHHAYRCIQAMLVHAAALVFSKGTRGKRRAGTAYSDRALSRIYYDRVIVGREWEDINWKVAGIRVAQQQPLLSQLPPVAVRREPALDFVWRLGTPAARALVERLTSSHPETGKPSQKQEV